MGWWVRSAPMLGLAALLAAPSAAQEEVEDWRILALRVDFPLEEPDEPTTTGRGGFDLRSLSEALPDYRQPYDTPPHDRVHYEHHLAALARYYDVVSGGRVRIESRVFPRALAQAYTLPRPPLYYGNGRTPEEIGRLWRELLVDAVDLAAADPEGPDFSAFDSYLVIHAGRGHETGQLNDIRSVFLRPGDLDEHGGPVEVERAVIREAWILPEAIGFRGRGGLNGLLAKFFGHQLGLPGLSNFARGLPAVGGWSLMDVGANRSGFVRAGDELEFVVGMVPPHPMAWSKARLGWIEPLEVRRDTVVQIRAGDRPAESGGEAVPAVRVPLSPTEYLLLENRQQRGRTEHDLPREVQRPDYFQFAWIEPEEAELSHRITAAESDSLAGRAAGVWIEPEEFDAFVPGSGVLIWHVDEAVMAAAPPEGFNNERERPGLMLVEADGSRDIGNPYFDRQDFVEGTRSDPFFAGSVPGVGNDMITGVRRFGADTTPATVTHTGLPTGLEVEVLSEPDDRMSVRLRFTRSAAGWPRPVRGVRRLLAADVDGEGAPELLAEGEGGLRVLSSAAADGATVDDALLAAGDGLLFTSSAAGLVSARPLGAGTAWERQLAGRPAHALYTDDLKGQGPVLAAGGPTGLSVLDAATGEVRVSHGAPVLGMAAADIDADGTDELLILGDGELLRYDGAEATLVAGDLAGSWMPPSAADLDGDGQADIVLAGRGGHLRSLGQGSGELRVSIGAPMVAPASFADLDGDGRLEVLAATAEAVHAWSAAGLRSPGFPVAPPMHQESGPLHGEVVAADLDASGAAGIFVSAGNGVYGFDGDGLLLSGFPVSSPRRPTTAPVLADFDRGGGLDLAVGDEEGVNLWRPVSWEPVFSAGVQTGWSQSGGSASGRRAHPSLPLVPPAPEAIDLLPATRAYCYPNPAGGDEPAHLRFYLGRPARVSLTVYDAMGEVVERLEAAGARAREANEITWSIRGYASGLYLCRLEARGEDGRRGEVTVRLAVSR